MGRYIKQPKYFLFHLWWIRLFWPLKKPDGYTNIKKFKLVEIVDENKIIEK
jgi:hypothetical protein